MLGAAAKEVVGVGDDVLVQRAGGGDQDRQRHAGAAAGAAGLLPRAGDGAGKAGQHRRIQPADVDAQLQRVGGDDGLHAAVAQPLLDLAPLRRADSRRGSRGLESEE